MGHLRPVKNPHFQPQKKKSFAGFFSVKKVDDPVQQFPVAFLGPGHGD